MIHRRALSMSPTITTPAMTQAGMILGTAAYMTPEQAKGRPVDKRSDIWAFGCVLFEMLTGRRAFDGEDVTDTLAAIVRSEPSWNVLPPDVPAQIRLLLRRCLEKDRKARISDVAVARFLLTETMPAPAAVVPPALLAARPLWKRVLPVAAAAVVAGAIVGAAAWMLKPRHPWRRRSCHAFSFHSARVKPSLPTMFRASPSLRTARSSCTSPTSSCIYACCQNLRHGRSRGP